MGTSLDSLVRSFAALQKHEGQGASGRSRRKPRPVASGTPDPVEEFTVIRHDLQLGWVFGPEVHLIKRGRHRPLPRGENHLSDHFFFRLEYELEKVELKDKGFALPASLVIADMPLGYATIFTAPFQTAGAKDGRANLPTAYDVETHDKLPAKHNPLGFSSDNLAAREQQSDLEAIAAICAAPRDIYLANSGLYRASLSSDLVTASYFAYNPNDGKSRWQLGTSRGSLNGNRSRQGIVLAPYQDLEKVRNEICLDMAEFEAYWLGAVKVGLAQFKGSRFRLSPALDETTVYAATRLGAFQAMAGIDETKENIAPGAPVAKLACFYAEHHLKVWNKYLLASGNPISTGVLDDAFLTSDATRMDASGELYSTAYLQALDDIDGADGELVRIEALIAGLKLLVGSDLKSEEEIYTKMRALLKRREELLDDRAL